MCCDLVLLTTRILARSEGPKTWAGQAQESEAAHVGSGSWGFGGALPSERKAVLSGSERIYEKGGVLFYNNFGLSWLEIKHSSF